MRESVSELTERPDVGCYIHGLFLEGARWEPTFFELMESKPKELYTEMAVIWLVPIPNRKPPTTGMYLCPIYKTLTRAGKNFLISEGQDKQSAGVPKKAGGGVKDSFFGLSERQFRGKMRVLSLAHSTASSAIFLYSVFLISVWETETYPYENLG